MAFPAAATESDLARLSVIIPAIRLILRGGVGRIHNPALFSRHGSLYRAPGGSHKSLFPPCAGGLCDRPL